MKTITLLITLMLAVVLAGCASSVKVQQDYDTRANFLNIRTFGWLAKTDDLPDDANEALTENSLLDKRIRKAVNIQLIKLGLQLSEQTPDVLVTYYTGLEDKTDIQTWGGFYGRRGRGYGKIVEVDSYKEGTLVLDVMDADSKEILWRGIAVAKLDKNLNTQEMQKQLDKAVQKMFEQLPAEIAS